MLKVKAPAKINLTLEVLGKRRDDYHEIRSVFQTIDLCDRLTLEERNDVTYACDLPDWAAEKSLLNKAVGLLQSITGGQKGAGIRLEKRIPIMAGLGGDSSDAAALLRGLDELWGLKLPANMLQQAAARLGSDVTFFLQGGTALIRGRGEIITRLPALQKMWLVLVVPDIPLEPGKTGRMYAALKPEHFTDGAITEKLVKALHNNDFDKAMLFNAFENVAFDEFSGLMVYKEHLIKLGAPRVHLAGSGPALFAVFQEKVKAGDFYKRCENQALKSYMAATR